MTVTNLNSALRARTINGAFKSSVCLGLSELLHALRRFVLLHIRDYHCAACVILHSSLLFGVVEGASLRVTIKMSCHRVNAVRLDKNVFDSHGSFHHGNSRLHRIIVVWWCGSHFTNRVIKVAGVDHPPVGGSPINLKRIVMQCVPRAHRPTRTLSCDCSTVRRRRSHLLCVPKNLLVVTCAES